MQTVILAAGEGTRLKPYTETIPKCLLKVGKKTILEDTLDQLPKKITEVLIIVGRLKDQIKKQIGSHFNEKRIKYIEQTEQLGTGHALKIAEPHLENGKFLVLMGDDVYLKKDIEKCLEFDLALLAQENESPERFGVLKMQNGILEDIVESPKISEGTLINCGLYVLDKRIFNYPLVAIDKKEFGLPQTTAKMSQIHPVKIVKASFWLPINTIHDLKKADKYIKKLYL